MATIAATVNTTNGTGQSEQALARIGFDGQRLLKLANRVASDYCQAKGMHLGDKREDLVSAMVERGLKAAMRYDSALTNGNGDHAQSFLAKHMEHAAGDYLRRKSEGFGDRRYGNDGRIVLSPMDDDPDPDLDEFERLISNGRLATWQQAADVVGMSLPEFLSVTMDKASKQVLRSAA